MTQFETVSPSNFAGLRIPTLIGTGNEILYQNNLQVTRGSAATVDQEVVQEDMTGRAVVSISNTGVITLGAFDGVLTRVQVRNYPIVKGDGTGTVTTDRTSVAVTINGEPIVVLSVSGTTGIVELTQAPAAGDLVRVTYFFDRTDTYTTDDVSDQVTAENAVVYGILGESFVITTGTNDEFILTVDSESETTITFPAGTYTAAQAAAIINGAGLGTLVASYYTSNEGKVCVQLTSDYDIIIGNGSANAVLGFVAGYNTSRNRVFYSFQRPIVDGTNGGITTTSTSDVIGKINGTTFTLLSVDGSTGAVTFPFAPAAGDTVTLTYYFNSWQDTFDYLGHIGITEITRCGITPDRADYIDTVDYVLKDDKIVWGTSSVVSVGETSTGGTSFGSTQISTTLVDNHGYLETCTPVSTTEFQLPFQPTTGNGRNSPLGSSLFQSVANDRIDLPTNRPDLVIAYWGFSVQDAINRGSVAITKVDSETSTITLAEAPEVGATVYASFYYNTIVDETYTYTCNLGGISGIGKYTIQDEDDADIYGVTFGSKSAGLSTITINFPSGSEYKTEGRFESSNTNLTGPIEETVTVTFGTTEDSPAMYTVPGVGPYNTVTGYSDKFQFTCTPDDVTSDVNLSAPGGACGFFASLIGKEVVYDASSGMTTYNITDADKTISFSVDGVVVTATAATGAQSLAAYVTAINTAALASHPKYHGSTQFFYPVVIAAGEYDKLSISYDGDLTGQATTVLTLTAGTYNSASDLAAEVQAQITAALLTYTVTCAANSNGQLEFTFAKNGPGVDNSAFLEIIAQGAPATDFAILAGLNAGAVAGVQTKIYDGPIARRYTVGAGALLYDRLILRNRLCPPSNASLAAPFNTLSQCELRVLGAPALAFTGLASGDQGSAGYRACVVPAHIAGQAGLVSGQDAIGIPVVVFYDGTGTEPANNVFKFTLENKAVTATFTASAGGTTTNMYPAGTATTVIYQVATAMVAAGFGANEAAVIAAGYLKAEGAGFYILSQTSDYTSELVIGNGSANTVLGFTSGDTATKTAATPELLASALMSHTAATVISYILDYATPTANYFAAECLATVELDSNGAKYLYLQTQAAGSTASIYFAAPSNQSALSTGSGLLAVVGNGARGEAGINGFYVVSTDPDGSGSIGTSVLNSGTGQDGIVGQTYRDEVTGLTFTILARTGGLTYPAASYFTLKCSKTFFTDSNIPSLLPGVEVLVTNTSGVIVGDTGLVDTFRRSGNEPAIGDLYYVSYSYTKQDFSAQIYTKISAIEAAFGVIHPDNPLSLAAYLMMTNGAVTVAIKQVTKDEGLTTASTTKYRDAVDSLATPFRGGLYPSIIVPLKGNSLEFFQYLAQHCDIQSSIRYHAERTAICGFQPSVSPTEAGRYATQISNTRLRLVYPDSVTLSLTDTLGVTTTYLVEGFYQAAALAGFVTSPTVDVATPWDRKRLYGFQELGRKLNTVQQSQIAQQGCTLISEDTNGLYVLQGLTTDMTNVLTRIPTVIQVVDEVQQQARAALDKYVGMKFLPGILTKIEGTLASLLKKLINQQIITTYTDPVAQISPDDPTVAEVSAGFVPVFPLLYIVVTFQVRASST
jgi:hypothetical protein